MGASLFHDLAKALLLAGTLGGCASIIGLSKYTAVDDEPELSPGGGDDSGTPTGSSVDGAVEAGPSACLDTPGASVTFALDTDLSKVGSAGRACADGGDAVAYSVVAMTSSSATLDRAPAAGCLLPCDQVVVVNLQGTASHATNVGAHQTLRVKSIDGKVVTFEAPKTQSFGDGASDDENLGTAATNQRVALQRIPFYADLTVKAGATLTAKPWDGVTGGVLYLRAAGAIDVEGVVSMDHAGFRGGVTSGAGPEDFAGRTQVGGGPGGNAAATGPGGDGAGAPATGAGSGGTNGCGPYAGGVGYIGGGGGAGNSGSCAAGAGAGGGAAYTVAPVHTPKDFSRWYLGGGGSAGAGGGTHANLAGGTPNGGAPGAAGGGIIYLEGEAISLRSARRVSSAAGAGGAGADGDTVSGDTGGGGGGGGGQGGSGGTIVLRATGISFVAGAVAAPGGTGGKGGSGGAGGFTGGSGAGGAGGAGAAFVTGNDVGGNGSAGGVAPFGDGGGGGRGGSSGPAGVVLLLQGGVAVPNGSQ